MAIYSHGWQLSGRKLWRGRIQQYRDSFLIRLLSMEGVALGMFANQGEPLGVCDWSPYIHQI